MCGIFGWAGKRPQDFNKAKFDILGIYNIERGKHSCGVATDGDIFIGVDSNRVYHDFLANSNYLEPQHYPFAIGHTRHATGGAHNVDNAHPFGFGTHKDHYEFIGVHNGKLHNHVALAKEHGLDTKQRQEKENLITWREKIDSELLLEMVYKNKDFKVLSQYKGAAALVFVNLREPNTVYFYHGKSKKYYNDVEMSEERPLFYWQEKKNSVYVSSIKKSLQAIGAPEEDVIAFDHNTVYKVVNGDVSAATKYTISRSKMQQSEYDGYTSQYQKKNDQSHSCGFPPAGSGKHNCSVAAQKNDVRQKLKDDSKIIALNAHNEKKSDVVNIYNDEPLKPMNEFKGGVYFNKLRYWRNGHVITGIYAYIPKFGFYYLSDQIKEATDRFYDIINKYFDPVTRDFIRAITEVEKKERSRLFIPFNMDRDNETDFPQLYYFYEGIRIQTETDYRACQAQLPQFSWEALSICASHPVCDINLKYKRATDQNILWNGAPATETIAPLGSGKVYTIINGNCKSIKTQEESDIESIKKIEDAVSRIEAIEKNILKDELEEIESHPAEIEYDEDLLEKDLEHFFKDTLRNFPGYIKRLKEYKGASRAENAKEILEVFVESATKLMTVDVTE